jgi:hypothetical protein
MGLGLARCQSALPYCFVGRKQGPLGEPVLLCMSCACLSSSHLVAFETGWRPPHSMVCSGRYSMLQHLTGPWLCHAGVCCSAHNRLTSVVCALAVTVLVCMTAQTRDVLSSVCC